MFQKNLRSALLALSLTFTALPLFSAPARALQVGSLREIEGDITCGPGTGGTMVYAETASFRIYICSDPNDSSRARFYRSFSRNGTPGLQLDARNYNPMQMRYFEFRNGNYTYVVQIPSGQIPNPVLGIEFPNGRRVEERITRYLAKQDVPARQGVCSFINANDVNVRSGPGTQFRVLTQLDRGAGVTAVRRSGNWVEISAIESRRFNGWVSNAFINGCSEDQFDRWRR
jgi:hypothetical protein